MHEQFSSSYEPHNEEYLLLSLEHVMHSHKEGVISLHEDFLFELSAFNLVIVYNHIFP